MGKSDNATIPKNATTGIYRKSNVYSKRTHERNVSPNTGLPLKYRACIYISTNQNQIDFLTWSDKDSRAVCISKKPRCGLCSWTKQSFSAIYSTSSNITSIWIGCTAEKARGTVSNASGMRSGLPVKGKCKFPPELQSCIFRNAGYD